VVQTPEARAPHPRPPEWTTDPPESGLRARQVAPAED
jgi:hypothetical protein